MSGDIVEFFPKADVPPEERAHRLKLEVDRLASLPVVEWLFYIESENVAEKHGLSCTVLKKMVEAAIKAHKEKVAENRAEDRRSEQRAEKKEKKESTARREEERKRQREQERADKEAERIEREEEEQRKKREVVFAEIAALPRMTHAVRLKEAAARLGKDDPEVLIEEFEVFFAARSLPPELVPWPNQVDTAELLAEIEAKFRRYVVAPESIVVATTLWVPFTYLTEIAVYAPKLLFQFPDRDAGKSTALHVIRWMVQRPYLAIEATGAAIYRIVDRLKPTLLLDEADTLFERSTVLAHIINSSWDNSGAKIPRAGPKGAVLEFDVYGTQAIAMKGLNLPDTTLSRCIVCMLWPKLPHEIVEPFNKRDDEGFVTLRRKLLRWSVDNAVALQAATPEGQFNNRIRNNWQLLWAIADLAGGEWPKRARAAALELETERDEPSEGLRLLAAIHDIFGTREAMTSAEICAALAAHPSNEWGNFHNKGPISQTQLAVLLKQYRIQTQKVSPAGVRLNGYFRMQFANAFARLLQKPGREPDIQTESGVKPPKPSKEPRPRK